MPARDLLCGDSALSTLDRLPTCARLRAHRQHQRHGVIALRGSLLVSPRRHRQKHHPSHKLLHRAKTPPQVPINTPDLSPWHTDLLETEIRHDDDGRAQERQRGASLRHPDDRLLLCVRNPRRVGVEITHNFFTGAACSLNLRPSLLFIYGQRSGCTHTNTRTHTQGCGGSQGFVAW